MTTVTTEKELGEALKNNQDGIIIEGDLEEKVIRIKAVGKVAWAACFVGIAAIVTLGIVIITSGGTAAPVAGPAFTASLITVAPVAASTMGIPALVSAVGIAIAGGGVAVLNKLRKYRIEKINSKKIVLHKK